MHIGETPDLFSNPPPEPERKPQAKSGAELRDRGIERAAQHAERVAEGWQEQALALLRAFARERATFTSEELRAYAAASGLGRPPDNRAWGSPMMRARIAGDIVPTVYETATDPKVHRNPIMRWRSTLFPGGA